MYHILNAPRYTACLNRPVYKANLDISKNFNSQILGNITDRDIAGLINEFWLKS